MRGCVCLRVCMCMREYAGMHACVCVRAHCVCVRACVCDTLEDDLVETKLSIMQKVTSKLVKRHGEGGGLGEGETLPL